MMNPASPSNPSSYASAGWNASIGSLLFLGLDSFEELDGDELLDFVKEHNATLNFPQKVSISYLIRRKVFLAGRFTVF